VVSYLQTIGDKTIGDKTMAKELTELGEWKVGQEVILNWKWGNSILPIERITDGRGGTIYVKGKSFDVSGNERTSDIWNDTRIVIATDDDKKRIAMQIRKHKLTEFDFQNLTLEQASEIVAFMREKGIVI
jgi:hypothetical protein